MKRSSITKTLRTFLRDERGATAIEYGLIAALLSVAIIAAMQSVRGEMVNTFGAVEVAVNGAISP